MRNILFGSYVYGIPAGECWESKSIIFGVHGVPWVPSNFSVGVRRMRESSSALTLAPTIPRICVRAPVAGPDLPQAGPDLAKG